MNRTRFFQYFGLIIVFILIVSCKNEGRNYEAGNNGSLSKYGAKAEFMENRYASGFSIKKYPGYKLVEVYDPWQGASGISYSYLLAADISAIDKSLLKEHVFIKTPVKRTVCTSTTHIAFLESLGCTESIVGISGSGLVNNKHVIEAMKRGEIIDVGYEQSMNLELLVLQKPDIVMMYGIESEITAFINKISDLDIPVIMNGDYLEKTPLGKLEWIKFVAAFYDMEEEAAAYFDSIAGEYEKIRQTAAFSANRPLVMEGLPWKDVWYVSPGNTVLANFIRDAGGIYIWDSLESSKAVPMDIESVYKKAAGTDIWINPGTAGSIDDILNNDSRFSHFSPVINSKVYNNNKRMGEGGGNDFWESGVTSPQQVLKDLVNIFHPGVLKDTAMVYYKKLWSKQ